MPTCATAYLYQKRLFDLGGTETHPDQAALTTEQARAATLLHALECCICGRVGTKVLRFMDYFELVYGVPLEAKKKGRKRA